MTVSAPGTGATDTITDFVTGPGGDVLNLDALLPGSINGTTTAAELSDYLSFDSDGTDTTIHVDPDGTGAGGVTLDIRLEGMDLTGGGANSDVDILSTLITDGNIAV